MLKTICKHSIHQLIPSINQNLKLIRKLVKIKVKLKKKIFNIRDLIL